LEYDDWLYTDEADDADIPTIDKKIDSIIDIIGPAEKRIQEMLIRPDMVESAFQYLEFFYNQTTNETLIKPWITENDTLMM